MSNDKISIDASEFVDIMLDSKSLDGIMDYINFDITQQEFER